MKHPIVSCCLPVLLLLLSFGTVAQTTITLPQPNHTANYDTTTRGFWFVAPKNMNITGLRVPSNAGTGPQYIQVMRLSSTMPVSSSSPSTSFATLAYISNATNGTIQNVNIQVSAGDRIGILGTADTVASTGAGAYSTTIGGQSVNLNRLGYSGHIANGAATSFYGVGIGGSGSIGRVEVYYDTASPCGSVASMALTNLNSIGASFSWQAPTGTYGYEYAVNTVGTLPPSVGITSTVNNFATVNGLQPSSLYYLHVRRQCNAGNWSNWDTLSFYTLDSCVRPGFYATLYVDSNNATFTWGGVNNAIGYQYLVNTTRATPLSNNPDIVTVNALTTTASVTGLKEKTWYYVHLRTLCAGNDSSAWQLDSFYTPIHCRAPEPIITNISVDQGVASWAKVPSALKYEYAITKADPNPPMYGVPWATEAYYLPYLNDGITYYFHVRTICLDINTQYRSAWSTIPFITFPVGIAATHSARLSLNVYPNPASEKLIVALNTINSISGTITITNTSGKEVYRAHASKNSKAIFIGNLPSGMYFLKFTNGDNVMMTKFHKL